MRPEVESEFIKQDAHGNWRENEDVVDGKEEREEAFNSIATALVIGFVEESTQLSNSLGLASIQYIVTGGSQ